VGRKGRKKAGISHLFEDKRLLENKRKGRRKHTATQYVEMKKIKKIDVIKLKI